MATIAPTVRPPVASDATSPFEINVKSYGAKGDASTDDTVAVQAAIDAASASTVGGQQYSGVVRFPPGVYKMWGIQLKSRVRLMGLPVNGQGYRENPVRFTSPASPPADSFMITQPAGNVRNISISGISAYGAGSGSTTGWLNLPDVTDGIFEALYIDNWGAEAAIIAGGNNRVSYSQFQGLSNRALVSTQRGSFTLSGADHQVSHCEFTGPGRDTVSSASLFCAAAKIDCNESQFNNSVFQIGDVGLAITGGSRNRFGKCRFDSNAAHGLLLSGGTFDILTGCAWSRNSYSGNGLYDHINVPSGGGSLCTFSAPMFTNNGRTARYCISDAKNSNTFFNTYSAVSGEAGSTGFWSSVSSTVTAARGRVTAVTANYVATMFDDVVLATGGVSGISVTLPAVARGLTLMVKKTDAGAGAITVTPASGTIDGSANATISSQNGVLRLVSNGTNWFAV